MSKALIGLAVLAFALAVLSKLAGPIVLHIEPEAFSRASSNLALLAIALLLLGREPRAPSPR